ncbi:MAG: hypothetical protein CMM47_09990 [Rhodospirillaceae bacterium]|nr:hypothetical protein [Rhodospirillaceae bacterium]
MTWALILDSFLAVLLLLMIAYAFLLNRRLATLRRDKGELEAFIKRFNDATDKANSSLKGLRDSAERNARIIGQAADKAQALRDELLFLIERADASADRLAKISSRPGVGGDPLPNDKPTRQILESAEGTVKSPKASNPPGAKTVSQKTDTEETVASEAESDLLNALRRAR